MERENERGEGRMSKGSGLAIAYRIYPKVSKVPPVFADDKYKLSELCLRSFKTSLGDVRIKMWVLLDKCPPQYRALFEKYFEPGELEFIELGGTGNAGTFGMQMEILRSQKNSDFVYFAEDDYFYLPGRFRECMEFLKAYPENSFVTPYNHPDYYSMDLHKYDYDILQQAGRKWRTASTTTMTFLTTKKTLEASWKTLWSYTKNNYDASLWMALTKKKILQPAFCIKSFAGNKFYTKIILKAYRHSLFSLLFGRKYHLYAPVESIATHMDSEYLAPGRDWHAEFQKNR